MTRWLNLLVAILGLAAIVIGCAKVSHEVAWIVGGSVSVLLAVFGPTASGKADG